MTLERLENNFNEEESIHTAEIIPQPPLNVGVPGKDNRINPHDLFTLFTATIILQNEAFVR
jgi:hypothetical protein